MVGTERSTPLIPVVLLAMVGRAQAASIRYSGGTGTAEDPHQIATGDVTGIQITGEWTGWNESGSSIVNSPSTGKATGPQGRADGRARAILTSIHASRHWATGTTAPRPAASGTPPGWAGTTTYGPIRPALTRETPPPAPTPTGPGPTSTEGPASSGTESIWARWNSAPPARQRSRTNKGPAFGSEPGRSTGNTTIRRGATGLRMGTGRPACPHRKVRGNTGLGLTFLIQ